MLQRWNHNIVLQKLWTIIFESMLYLPFRFGRNGRKILHRYANRYETPPHSTSSKISACFSRFGLFRPVSLFRLDYFSSLCPLFLLPLAIQSSPPKSLFLLPSSSSSFFPPNSLFVVCTFSYFFFAFLVQVP